MGGKFAKKKAKKKSYLLPVLVVILLVLAIAAALLFLLGSEKAEPDNAKIQAEETAAQGTVPEKTEGLAFPIKLGDGLEITNIASYAGIYMEDGTDEVVSGVMMLVLKNNASEDLQLAKITLQYADGAATFSVTNLPAGKEVVLLEENRKAYISDSPADVETKNVVFVPAFEMYEDVIQITTMDGAMNIKNISGADISGDVSVYYKNVVGGTYYGGITYRVKLEGGLKAGEIRQIMSQHFDQDGSEIVMVTCAG